MNDKKSNITGVQSTIIDTASARKQPDSIQTQKNVAENKPPTKLVDQKKNIRRGNSSKKEDKEVIPETFTIPEKVNGNYYELATANELTLTLLNPKINFSMRIEGYSASGKLIPISPFKFKIVSDEIGGELQFNNDYDKIAGNISFTKIKTDAVEVAFIKR